MLLAAILASVLNMLRHGPNTHEFTMSFIKDTACMNVASTTTVQNSADYTRNIKDVRICLGDVKPDKGEDMSLLELWTGWFHCESMFIEGFTNRL